MLPWLLAALAGCAAGACAVEIELHEMGFLWCTCLLVHLVQMCGLRSVGKIFDKLKIGFGAERESGAGEVDGKACSILYSII